MSSEGARLRETWSNALKNAQTKLRELLVSSAPGAQPATLASGSSSSSGSGTSSGSAPAVPSGSTAPSLWRPVPIRQNTTNASASGSNESLSGRDRGQSLSKGKNKASAPIFVAPDPADVIVHRRPSKDGDVYRAVLDVYVPGSVSSSSPSSGPNASGSGAKLEPQNALLSLEAWSAVLATPELRSEYDPAVQDGRIIEMFDPETRIARTDFALGWPANPRDAITIAKSYMDSTTLIDICTSLPRSADEPAYLRPAPPFVRSHIHLYAWCIQITAPPDPSRSPTKVRVTCFWQHDLKAIWGVGNSIQQRLPSMLVGLVSTVQTHGSRMPHLHGYGRGVHVAHVDFQGPRQLLTLEYAVAGEDEEDDAANTLRAEGLDDGLRALKEYRRLERSVECTLPSAHSWDVRIHTRASSSTIAAPHFMVQATQPSSSTSSSSSLDEPVTLRISHPRPPEHTVLRITVAIEPSASLGAGANARQLRVNGSSQTIHHIEPRDPSSSIHFSPPSSSSSSTSRRKILEDASTIGSLALQRTSTNASSSSASSATTTAAASIVTTTSDKTTRTAPGGLHGSGRGGRPGIPGVRSTRSAAAEKAVVTLVRRNYIYFTSLLQEPEAKWSKPITESRGVTVTQLNSIDPTLVVYRAEAVFVGVGVWDLLSIVATPGVGAYWNRGQENAVYLEHVSELTELWHLKNRAAWPVNARDSVQVKTTYKSSTACHVFSFSTDDDKLFPSIPPLEPAVIRTQVDLQGWAIEALSPNTTLLTLLDQSDPKGWSNKSSIPSQMIAAVAGMGEFAIKYGGPPMATRMMGAKIVNSRYDYEKNVFRLDYETTPPPSSSPPPASNTPLEPPALTRTDSDRTPTATLANDADTGSELTPLANTVDLPDDGSITTTSSPASSGTPATVECELRCDIDTWANSLDIIVDPAPQTLTCLRRHKLASGGSGLWLTVEHDAAKVAEERITIVVRKGGSGSGSKDRGAVLVNGVKIRVDVEELPDHEVKSLSRKKRIKPARIPLDQPPVITVQRPRGGVDDVEGESPPPSSSASPGIWSFASPLGKLFSISTPETAIASAVSSSPALGPIGSSITPSPDARSPMHCAFDALSRVRELHSQSISDGWTLVNEKDIAVYRKIDARISSKIAIHKAQKIIEGYGAEEIAAVIANEPSRTQWDDRIDSVLPLDVYGAGCSTAFVVTKAGFPFRDRGFYVAKLVARIMPDEAQDGAEGDVRQRTMSVGATAGRGRSPNRSTKPTALICVSVSYATVTPRRYSHQKVNPFTLPIGQILVEGWVLETLDPYTSQNLAIPSTRCTLITGLDLAGSVPLSYTNSYNAANVRAILSMEKYLKGRSPPPYPILPAPVITIDEMDDHDLSRSDGQLFSWQLGRVDPIRHLLNAAFSPDDGTYRVSVLLTPRAHDLAPAPRQTDAGVESVPPSRPSTPSRTTPRQAPAATNRDSSPARSSHFRSLSRTSGAVFPSSSSTSPLPRSRTMSISISSRLPSLPSFIATELMDEATFDLVVGEIVLDTSFYKTGCDVHVSSKLVSPADDSKSDNVVGLSNIPTSESDLPIQCAVHSLPTATLASNSLSSPVKRYILLLTLPTAQYNAPTIRDPLTGKSTTAPPRPDWLNALEEHGAILNIEIKPSDERKFAVKVDGDKISSTHLPSRFRLESDGAEEWPRLQRIPFDPDAEGAMEHVVASATHLFDDKPPPSSTPSEATPSSGVTDVDADVSPFYTPPGASTPATPADAPATGLMGFLGQYRRGPTVTIPPNHNNSSYWPSSATLSSLPGRWLSRQNSVSSLKTISSPVLKSPSNGELAVQVQVPAPPRIQGFSLHAVVFIAVISFLLGSLLRSILSPADFVLINGHIGRGVPEWQEIKRFLHIHAFSRGLVVGLVRRAPH